jgi:hypothetical protein
MLFSERVQWRLAVFLSHVRMEAFHWRSLGINFADPHTLIEKPIFHQVHARDSKTTHFEQLKIDFLVFKLGFGDRYALAPDVRKPQSEPNSNVAAYIPTTCHRHSQHQRLYFGPTVTDDQRT